MKIKSIVSVIAIAFCLVSSDLLARESVDKELDVADDGIVQISNVRGYINVEGWSKDKVSVKGVLDEMATSLTFETSGKVTTIRVEMPKGRINHGDGSNLKIRVPTASQVEFEGVSTDLDISDIEAGIDVRSVSGDVDAKSIETRVFIKTVSGDLDIEKSKGPSRLSTVSGDIMAKMDSSSIEVNAVSGDIRLEIGAYEYLDASAVNGEVNVRGAQVDGGETSISSVNGDLVMSFTDSLNARVIAKTGPGGEIINKLTSDEVEKIFPNQAKLNCTVGDGNGKVTLSTLNGTIKLSGD